MNDDQIAAVPIAFPLSLHQTTIGKKPRRWLIPADARFLVDTRQKLFGRVASHLTKPGEWVDTYRDNQARTEGTPANEDR